VVIVGSRKAAAIAVRNNRVRERHTRLAERLAEAHPVIPPFAKGDTGGLGP
jgi:hypothetical protein